MPLHPDTAAALEQFVTGKGKHSILRKSAMLGAVDIFSTLWQSRDYYRMFELFTRQGHIKGGRILHTQIQLAWLMRSAPVTGETRAMLEELSDDKRYFIGSHAAARLALAWARFGDLKRAEGLLASARKARPGKYDHTTLTPGNLGNGRVSGRISMSGTSSDDIRVGLFRLTDDGAKPVSAQGHKKRISFNSTGISLLTESVLLKADGRFSLQNLGEGDYYLAVLIPDDKLKDKAGLGGANIPDLIKINVTSPHRDLGVIRLTAQ